MTQENKRMKIDKGRVYQVRVETINDQDRTRRDYGDLDSLAKSIDESELYQPIVIRDDHTLIVGGRRLAAFKQLGREKIPAIYKKDVSDETLLIMEAEENLQRKDFDWKELVAHVQKIMRLKFRTDTGERWTQELVSKVLKVTQGYVSIALMVGRELENDPEGPVSKASSLWEALDILTRKREDEAYAELRRKNAERLANEAAASVEVEDRAEGPASVAGSEGEVAPQGRDLGAGARGAAPGPGSETRAAGTLISRKLERLWQGDALELIPKMAARWPIHHIVTDPPYAQDMSNMSLNTDKVDRTREEHEVEPNLRLIKDFLKVAFDHIDERGFLVMWYTLEHHEKIRDHARSVGWKVQEWPFFWCKTSYCMNKAAQYNMTSKVETCFIMRRSSSSILAKHQGDNFMVSDNPRGDHAFFKPLPIWNRLINAVSLEGQNILDPFCGEGSCLKATLSAGRIPMGMELKAEHYNIAYEQLLQMINRFRGLEEDTPPDETEEGEGAPINDNHE